jgi:hypothetical protein
MAWQVHAFLIGMYFTLQWLNTERRLAQRPEGTGTYLAPTQVPESDFFVQFFGFHVMVTTITIAAVILGKDLFLSPPRARMWNIALAMFCGLLLLCGWLSLGIMEGSWGIVH